MTMEIVFERVETFGEKEKMVLSSFFTFFQNVYRAFFVKVICQGPNNKFSDWFKLEAFAEGKIYVTEKLTFALRRVENIVGKRENAGYQHFLFFPQCSQKDSFNPFPHNDTL